MIKCDNEGVPKLVQSIEYHPYPMLVKATLVDDSTVTFCVESFLPHIGIAPRPLEDEEWVDLDAGVEDYVSRYWGSLHRKYLRVV